MTAETNELDDARHFEYNAAGLLIEKTGRDGRVTQYEYDDLGRLLAENWLFAGSERGGRTAAVLFTLISSAKRHKLNTWAYLRDVLWGLADLKPGGLEELLPDRWRDSRPP